MELDRDSHVRYCLRSLRMLPDQYQVEDTGRMALAYFCLSSLALLDALDRLGDALRSGYVEWVFARWKPEGGFSGGCDVVPDQSSASRPALDPPHLVHTYTALLALGLLSAPAPAPSPFDRIDRHLLLSFVKSCQRRDGSFTPFPASTESDVRFVYCALAIYSMLGLPPSCADSIDSAVSFLSRCRTYEGGYGQEPGLESHGGSTYCALAAMDLVGRLDRLDDDQRLQTTRWLVGRQVAYVSESEDDEDEDDDARPRDLMRLIGFQGRPGKPPDACYSFWCSAALSIIAPGDELYDAEADRAHLLACQSQRWGGIARAVGDFADVYHTYLSLAALSVGGRSPELAALDASLNVATSVSRRIRDSLSDAWETSSKMQ